VFDTFVSRNRLRHVVTPDAFDRVIAHAFQRGELPERILGDLWARGSAVLAARRQPRR
jgi:hypothetical protein